jgi:hypothetical protein
MPNTSRAQRRQASRGGGPKPPKRRDPMIGVYIGFAIFVVAILAIFAAINLEQQHAVTVANATPTPGPNASQSPIPLENDEHLGAPVFPNPIKVNPHDGLPVDGITCTSTEQVTLHIHSHLALFYKGKQLEIPAGVGLAPVPPSGCLYWIHTHDTSGIIHIEAPQIEAPQGGGPFTLGMFFDIWGQPLTSSDVAGKLGPVAAFVNGMRWYADPRTIPLLAHQEITLEVGKPIVPPPNYAFPYGD